MLFCLTVPAVWLALKGLNDALSAARREAKDRKRSEEALRTSEERLRLAWDTSPDYFSISRLKDAVMVDVNKGFTQLTGYTREEVVGRSELALKIVCLQRKWESEMGIFRGELVTLR